MPPFAVCPPQAPIVPLSAAPSQMPQSSEPTDISQDGAVDLSLKAESDSSPMNIDVSASAVGGLGANWGGQVLSQESFPVFKLAQVMAAGRGRARRSRSRGSPPGPALLAAPLAVMDSPCCRFRLTPPASQG